MNRPLIAILRGVRPEESVAVANALVEAGIRRIEVPLNSPQAFESIAAISAATDAGVETGAGTVLTVKDVDRVKRANGQFIVSPNMNTDVIRATKSAGMLSLPGVLTPSECFDALAAGADGLKLFPSFVIGTEGMQAIQAVLPATTRIYVVGGIAAASIEPWLLAGADGFGFGTSIYKPGRPIAQIASDAAKIVRTYDRVLARCSAGLTGEAAGTLL